MNKITGSNKVAMGVALTAALACAGNLMAADEFDYANLAGGSIAFTGGGNFDFVGGFDTTASTLSGGSGLDGTMSGTWNINTISGNTADVSGSGTLTIADGLGHNLTGTLVWNTIEQTGATGGINYLASVNLTGVTYSGANAALVTLATQGNDVDVLTFQFTSTETLSALVAGGLSTSYSGSINASAQPGNMAPDGGLTVALMGGALVGLAGLRRKLA